MEVVKPFEGLVVLDMATTQAAAPVGQFLADYGADVLLVEPPGGRPLRGDPGFPYWSRGKRSVELDLHQPDQLAELHALAAGADVVIQTFRPGVAERLRVDHATLSAGNPRLVHLSVTGFAPAGPYADAPGYELVVQAKVGALAQATGMVHRPGPAFISAPYCSASAAHLATHGVLAALIERERSGLGQHVQISMAQALAAHDTWNGMAIQMAKRYPDAFVAAPPVDEDGVPIGGIFFRLLTAVSADGAWLQFSQTADRLFQAFMRALELDWMFDDPEWRTLPNFETSAQRRAFWDLLLQRVQGKTRDEWMKVFDEHPDVWAEVFRHGTDVFEHPQFVHDGSVTTVDDPVHGPIRQFVPLVRIDGERPPLTAPAPALGQHAGELAGAAAPAANPAAASGTGDAVERGRLPLEGLVVLEFATQYAAPYGATLLTDLGARVIKVEEQSGDQIRVMSELPDVGSAKVTQGKESIALDLRSEDGLRIVHDLVRRADVVLQGFRAGVAERRSIDAETLRRINPDLVYVSAPAYGTSGPCAHRPAYAPTIGAACGLAARNVGFLFEQDFTSDLDAVKAASMQLRAANMGAAHADGFASLGVGTALLLGIYTRERGLGAHRFDTSMLLTTAHTMADGLLAYDGRPDVPTVDEGLHGLSALYRLYEAAEGWVVLAAPAEKEWPVLCRALAPHYDVAADPRFATAEARRRHDAELAEVLGGVFRTRPASTWEEELLAQGVGCVRVTEETPFTYLLSDEFGRASGFVVEAEHPIYGEHLRVAPYLHLSRSRTQALGGCLNGQHTDAILTELGYDDDRIKDLHDRNVVT